MVSPSPNAELVAGSEVKGAVLVVSLPITRLLTVVDLSCDDVGDWYGEVVFPKLVGSEGLGSLEDEWLRVSVTVWLPADADSVFSLEVAVVS